MWCCGESCTTRGSKTGNSSAKCEPREWLLNQFDYVGQSDSSAEQTCAGSNSAVYNYMKEQVFAAKPTTKFIPPGFLVGQQAACGRRPRSISVWIKTGFAGASETAVATGAEEAGQSYNIRVVSCYVGVFGYNKDHTTTRPSVCDNTWHHVMATYDGKTNVVYVDGEVAGTKDLSLDTKCGAGVLGDRIPDNYAGGQDYWRGSIKDLQIFSVALDRKEVRRIMGEIKHDVTCSVQQVSDNFPTAPKPESAGRCKDMLLPMKVCEAYCRSLDSCKGFTYTKTGQCCPLKSLGSEFLYEPANRVGTFSYTCELPAAVAVLERDVVSVVQQGCNAYITNPEQEWSSAMALCTNTTLGIVDPVSKNQYTGDALVGDVSSAYSLTGVVPAVLPQFGEGLLKFSDSEWLGSPCAYFQGQYWDQATQTDSLVVEQSGCNVTLTNPDSIWGSTEGTAEGKMISVQFGKNTMTGLMQPDLKQVWFGEGSNLWIRTTLPSFIK